MIQRAIVLAAPKFHLWPIGIAKQLRSRNNGIEIIVVVVGPKAQVEALQATNLFTEVHHVDTLERIWLQENATAEELRSAERRWGVATLRGAVASDRHLGAGYVNEAIMEPTPLAQLAKNSEKLEAYLLGLFDWADDLIGETTDVVFCYCVAGSIAYALASVAKAKAVPFRQLAPARIEDYYIMDNSIKGTLDPVRADAKEGHFSDAELEDAQRWLASLRANQLPPDYSIANERWDASEKNDYVRRAKEVAWLVKKQLVGEKEMLLRKPSMAGRRRQRKRRLTGQHQAFRRARMETVQGLRGRNFVYFPLHVQPEASMHVMAPLHTSQIPVVEAISKALPLGYDLVVKEHAPMLGLRPQQFYDQLLRIPGVKMVKPNTRSADLIKAAKAVCTITGTAAWEAAVVGTPSITFGATPWQDVIGGIYHVADLHDLQSTLQDALTASTPINEGDLVRFLASVKRHGFHFPADLYWGEVRQKDVDDNEEILVRLVQELERAVNGSRY